MDIGKGYGICGTINNLLTSSASASSVSRLAGTGIRVYFVFTRPSMLTRVACAFIDILIQFEKIRIRYSHPFWSPLHSIKDKMFSILFSISSRTLEIKYANARFNFDFGRSILKHCHSVSCFVTPFRHLQFKFVGHST